MTSVARHPRDAAPAARGWAPGAALPRRRCRSGAAPLKNNNYQLLQVVLFWAGAVLLPLGLVVIVLGWYGVANTPYQYDQLSYLISGGLARPRR